MRPVYLFAFLFSLCLSLMVVFALIPEGIIIRGYRPKTFTFSDWFRNSDQAVNTEVSGSKLLELQSKTEKLALLDSQQIAYENINQDGDSTQGQTLPEVDFHIDSASGIQFPGGDSSLFKPFFTLLDSSRKGTEPIRILHLGDSQIEGDRITGYLRQRLQQIYGGCGPGLIPLYEELPSRFSVEIRSNEPAERYLLYGKPALASHNRYSVLHSLFHLNKDTTSSATKEKQSFSFKLRNSGFQRATWFEKATVLMRNPVSDVKISSSSFSKEKLEKISPASDSLKLISFRAEGKKKALSILVEGEAENDYYGVCLDCPHGVAVDNVPLRGSSGLEILKINPRFLQEQIRRLHIKLVILQFGVNVVPYESPSFSWYENSLVRIIQTLKKSDPELQVLVIGVSDMAKKTDGQWQSYPNIEAIRIAQKNAAFRTKSAFWDMYEVMGGKNSILAWAGTNPPLAGKDYVHLTPKGAQVMGEFLFQALEKVRTQYKSGM